ncbi:CLUMA_CG003825, isoform A [Clunio marinus]|uniref:CLUMA_CG003825, isoform A n=1 Tax=Clunio marinus TaxID=568069 RepID=A0A1J1HQ51_9DIPT|nr:CLUMA_CG003825, isoform A [Clunio marinus]
MLTTVHKKIFPLTKSSASLGRDWIRKFVLMIESRLSLWTKNLTETRLRCRSMCACFMSTLTLAKKKQNSISRVLEEDKCVPLASTLMNLSREENESP